jgi:hypothetical protein
MSGRFLLKPPDVACHGQARGACEPLAMYCRRWKSGLLAVRLLSYAVQRAISQVGYRYLRIGASALVRLAPKVSERGPRRMRMRTRMQYIHQPQLACPRLTRLIRRPPSVPALLPEGQWGRPFAIASVIETRCASMYVNATRSPESAVTTVK